MQKMITISKFKTILTTQRSPSTTLSKIQPLKKEPLRNVKENDLYCDYDDNDC